VRAGAKPVRYVSLVREVRLQDVVRVGFDAMKKNKWLSFNCHSGSLKLLPADLKQDPHVAYNVCQPVMFARCQFIIDGKDPLLVWC